MRSIEMDFKNFPKPPHNIIKREVTPAEFIKILRKKPGHVKSTVIDLPKLGSNNLGKLYVITKSYLWIQISLINQLIQLL